MVLKDHLVLRGLAILAGLFHLVFLAFLMNLGSPVHPLVLALLLVLQVQLDQKVLETQTLHVLLSCPEILGGRVFPLYQVHLVTLTRPWVLLVQLVLMAQLYQFHPLVLECQRFQAVQFLPWYQLHQVFQ